MKKIILSVGLAAFAVAVQAGESKAACSDKDGGCCAKATATTTKVDSKQTGSCCAAMARSGHKSMHVTHVLQSPKAATLG
ncbi:MAG TPA: hypothetical protein VN578_10680 [Candidatus Binatia bacterium]|jgi:hypothetical protein|nr:hypothetical protein [Candidatus Binatia bacterium]